MISNVFNKIALNFKKNGIEHVLLEIFRNYRWPKWLFSYSRTELLCASTFKPISKKLLEFNFEINLATKANIDDVLTLIKKNADTQELDYEKKYKKILYTISQGNCVYIAYDRSIPVGYLYLFKNKREIEFSGDIKNKVIFGYGEHVKCFGYGYVANDYRLKGVFPLLMHFAIDDNPDAKFFIADINPLNTISINSHRRFGYKIFGHVKLIRIMAFIPIWLITIDDFYKFSITKNLSFDLNKIFPVE